MAGLEIADYRAALAILEHRHFGRAAAQLGVTQPSLTSRLQRMEQRLGVRLFHRNRRGVEPTAIGLAVLEAAQDVVRASEAAEAVVRDAAQGLGQILRIGFTQIAAQTVVVGALASFRRRHPKIRLRLVEGPSAPLEAALEGHALDLAFIHPPVHTSGLRHRVLHLSEGRRLRLSADAPPDKLIGYPNADAPILMSHIADEVMSDGAETQMDALANTVLGAIILARAGCGAAIVPADHRHPLIDEADTQMGLPLSQTLQTAIAHRATDRRDAVQDLVRVAMEASEG